MNIRLGIHVAACFFGMTETLARLTHSVSHCSPVSVIAKSLSWLSWSNIYAIWDCTFPDRLGALSLHVQAADYGRLG
jgi:hypothetical protein